MSAASRVGLSQEAYSDFCFAYGIEASLLETPGSRAQDSPASLADLEAASAADGASLLYGELLPEGLHEALRHLGAETLEAGTLLELGSGSGKLALQALLALGTTGHLRSVIGVELAPSRHKEAVLALKRLALRSPGVYGEALQSLGRVALTVRPRPDAVETHLELRCGDFFCCLQADEIAGADVVLLQVCIPPGLYGRLFKLLARLKTGAHVLSLLDLVGAWRTSVDCMTKPCPVRPFAAGTVSIPTSWAPEGHKFFLLEAVQDDGLLHSEASRYLDLQSEAVGVVTLREGVQICKIASSSEAVNVADVEFLSEPVEEGEPLCEGVENGACIPCGLLPPSNVLLEDLRGGLAVEVACAHCLRTTGVGARLYEEEEVCEVDPEIVDWLPALIAAQPRLGPDGMAVIDVLHEDGTVEACIAPERVRYPAADVRNAFGLHRGWAKMDTE